MKGQRKTQLSYDWAQSKLKQLEKKLLWWDISYSSISTIPQFHMNMNDSVVIAEGYKGTKR